MVFIFFVSLLDLILRPRWLTVSVQLRVSLVYAPDQACMELEDTLWSDDTDKNFFTYIRKSSGYAQNHPIMALDIQIGQT